MLWLVDLDMEQKYDLHRNSVTEKHKTRISSRQAKRTNLNFGRHLLVICNDWGMISLFFNEIMPQSLHLTRK